MYDVQGANVKENVKKRGVDDKDLLPNYYYRDDGILIWDAIESYVADIIGIFYKSDDDVKEDTEVQSWAEDVHFHAFPGYDGVPHGHGFPDKMESREDLINYCTLIIFTALLSMQQLIWAVRCLWLCTKCPIYTVTTTPLLRKVSPNLQIF